VWRHADDFIPGYRRLALPAQDLKRGENPQDFDVCFAAGEPLFPVERLKEGFLIRPNLDRVDSAA